MTSYLTFVHALSSLHPGTGQGSGIIDLPIAREKATGLPYLPGSSLKGTLRTHCPARTSLASDKTVEREQIFGSEETNGETNTAGTIQISDQRLLLLPVRSLAGTFAWVTSPYVLHRLARDMAVVGSGITPPPIPQITSKLLAYVISNTDKDVEICQLIADPEKPRIYLEDLDFQAQKEPDVRAWAQWLGKQIFENDEAWQRMFYERLCIVHDDVLSFLLKTATEVIARIRLEEDSKTVRKGGLWYEEALPTETILSGMALVTPRSKSTNGHPALTAEEIGEAFEQIAAKHLQLGGKSTVGRGQCRVYLSNERK